MNHLHYFYTFLADIHYTPLKPGNLPQADPDHGHIITAINVVLEIIGALALLMITVSGLRYVFSGGDESKVRSAKSGIVYALVGLVVAVMARAIVFFVANRI